MRRVIAYLDCTSGISGAQLLGAVVNAGLPIDALQRCLASLSLQDYRFEQESVHEQDIHGLRVSFTAQFSTALPKRIRSQDMLSMLHNSLLSQSSQQNVIAMVQRVADAQTDRIPGIAREELLEIVCIAWSIEALHVTQLYASPPPLPKNPLTLEILKAERVPCRPSSRKGERVTVGGAALLAELARFETPAFHIERVGYGFAPSSLSAPNWLRLCVGQTYSSTNSVVETTTEADVDWVAIVECHVDNMSGELLGGLMERLFATGALDVSYTPLQMKKNRPAIRITVICLPQDGERFALLLLRESSTLGVRIQQMQRLKAQRSSRLIATPLGDMSVKVKRLGTHIISAAPEYEECSRLAQQHNLPLAEVYAIAQYAIQSTIIGQRQQG